MVAAAMIMTADHYALRTTTHFPIWLLKRNGELYGKCVVVRGGAQSYPFRPFF
jgi:hypothetical protein